MLLIQEVDSCFCDSLPSSVWRETGVAESHLQKASPRYAESDLSVGKMKRLLAVLRMDTNSQMNVGCFICFCCWIILHVVLVCLFDGLLLLLLVLSFLAENTNSIASTDLLNHCDYAHDDV